MTRSSSVPNNSFNYQLLIFNFMEKNFNWSKLLKVIIAVLTALAGSLGVVSCM